MLTLLDFAKKLLYIAFLHMLRKNDVGFRGVVTQPCLAASTALDLQP